MLDLHVSEPNPFKSCSPSLLWAGLSALHPISPVTEEDPQKLEEILLTSRSPRHTFLIQKLSKSSLTCPNRSHPILRPSSCNLLETVRRPSKKSRLHHNFSKKPAVSKQCRPKEPGPVLRLLPTLSILDSFTFVLGEC